MTDNRFTVSTVDGECKKNGIHMGATIITRPLRSSAEMVERGTAVVAPSKEHQGETWLHDAGWRRKRSVLAESHSHGSHGHHQASAELSRDGGARDSCGGPQQGAPGRDLAARRRLEEEEVSTSRVSST
ncbi:hypothetical protein O0L34_g12882 [Tuta absoluta]|nr:hypothetical protein O0L34_g12882 [Tuta absoluta]